MKVRNSELVTGFFILVCVALFGFLFFNSGKKIWGSSEQLCVAFFDNVALLEKGNPVTIRGYQVGKVISIKEQVSGDDVKIRVVFDVQDDIAEQLRGGSQVTIKQASFLGGKYIDLAPSFEGAELPEDEGALVLKAIPGSDLFSILADAKEKLEGTITSFNALLDRLRINVLSDENIRRIEELLDNGNELATTLNSEVKKVTGKLSDEGGTIDQANDLLRESKDLMAQLQQDMAEIKAGGLETLTKAQGTLDEVNGFLESTSESVSSLQGTIQDDLVPRVNGTLDSAKGLLARVDGRVDPLIDKIETLLEDTDRLVTHPDLYGTLYETRLALRELKLLSRSLRADPSQVLFGGPGEIEEDPSKQRDQRDQRLGRKGEAL